MNSSYNDHFKNIKKRNSTNSDRVTFSKKHKTKKQNIAKSSQPTDAERALRNALSMKSAKKTKHIGLGSIIAGLTVSLATIASIWIFFNSNLVESIIENIEISFFSKSSAANKEEKSSQTKAENQEENSSNKEDEKNQKPKSVSENLNYYSALNDRKVQLDLRERELEKLEEELHKQRLEIEERISHLEKIRRDISGVLSEKVEIDQKKVKTLVEFYSNMKPQQAAKIIGTVNEDLAIEVLGQMKKKNAAEIMNLLEPKKAQIISEKFAGYQRR